MGGWLAGLTVLGWVKNSLDLPAHPTDISENDKQSLFDCRARRRGG